jgi:Co/Zn/Cd efflux system component
MLHPEDVTPETWTIVGGRGAGAPGDPLNVPLYPSSNFIQGEERIYTRNEATPGWEALEQLVGGLEGGEAVAFASGMAACAAVLVLAAPAALQAAIYVATGSVALLADLIHNVGDALTAVPLAVAFALRSPRAERVAGLLVVAAIAVSAIVAGVLAVERIVAPLAPDHLLALALAGAVGVAGNAVAAGIRLRGGRRLHSPALVADGEHARADALVSVGVVLSAVVVAVGAPIADPIIGLAISALILRITWQSWRTVRGHRHQH